jgi:hypothetical protein
MSSQSQQTSAASTKDQPMKDVQSKEEVKKGETMEGGIMPRMDLWKDFDDWHKSIFDDFSKIDQEMDRRFRDFSDMINKNRERQLEDFRKTFEQTPSAKALKQEETGAAEKQLAKKPEAGELSTLTAHSYTKERRQVETRALQIGRYRILYKMIDQTKEKDGVELPHIVRQIDCNPAAPINILKENTLFEEFVDQGLTNKILHQFEEDTKNVPENEKPHRIIKYVNSVMTEDPKNKQSGKMYGVKVVYLNRDNDRYRYTFQKRQGDANPQVKIERSTKLFQSFFF